MSPISSRPFQDLIRLSDPHKPDSDAEKPGLLDSIWFCAVRNRRTIERRLSRRMGDPNWYPHGSKLIKKRKDLIVCETCGNWHIRGYLCVPCYRKVEAETKKIFPKMAEFCGIRQPIDKEVVIKYKGESKEDLPDKVYVEIEDERPDWFPKSLLKKTGARIPDVNVTTKD